MTTSSEWHPPPYAIYDSRTPARSSPRLPYARSLPIASAKPPASPVPQPEEREDDVLTADPFYLAVYIANASAFKDIFHRVLTNSHNY